MVNQQEVAQQWLDITVERLKGNIKRLNIRETGELEESIKGFIDDAAGGDVKKIQLFYKWYGMLVDMGVGTGTKYGQQRDNAMERSLLGKRRGNARKPKQWFTKTMASEVKRLSEISGQLYMAEAVQAVYGSLDKQVTINF